MALGNKLKELLAERGITVKDFAQDIGVPSTTLYSFIKRDSETGKLELIAKICQGLEISINEFLTCELQTFATAEDFFEAWNKDIDAPGETLTIIHKASPENRLLTEFSKLNERGKEKAIEQVKMVTGIPEYQLEQVIDTVAQAVQDGHIHIVKKKENE